MLKLLVRLSTLSLGISFVMCTTTSQQQNQLSSLNDRLSQVITALYSSPLLSKPIETSESTEDYQASPPPDDPTYTYTISRSPPQVVYVSQSPTFLEAGAEPNDYGYPTPTKPVTRQAWPYPYEYSYPQYPQVYPPQYPAPRPFGHLSEIMHRPAYPKAPSPQLPAYPGVPSPQFSGYPGVSTPRFPALPGPSMPAPHPSLPYPSPIQYSPLTFHNLPIHSAYPPSPYPVPSRLPSPYPSDYPSALPQPASPYLPPMYSPQMYSPFAYPPSMFPSIYSKYSEMLPQQRYEYNV